MADCDYRLEWDHSLKSSIEWNIKKHKGFPASSCILQRDRVRLLGLP